MGKVKKKSPVKTEGQKKISSFFQMGQTKPAESSLFTTTGGTSNTKSSKLSLKKSSNEKSRYTETTKIGEKQETKELCSVIPETQVFKSPVTPKVKEDIVDLDNSIVIPGTPQEDAKEEKSKSKRCFSRSFLTSATNISERPGRHNAKEQLKKMSQARKSLISVSVNFNDNVIEKNAKTETTKIEKLVDHIENEVIEKKNFGIVDKNSEAIICNKVEQDKSSNQAEIRKVDMIVDTGIHIGVKENALSPKVRQGTDDLKVNNRKYSPEEKENYGATPTKVYNEGCLKRMSKPGTSPGRKRKEGGNKSDVEKKDADSDSSEFELNFEDEETDEVKNQMATIKEDSVDRVRRSLSQFEKKTRKKIRPNASALNKYQLTMNRPKIGKEVLKTEDDMLLGELLGEITVNSKSLERKGNDYTDLNNTGLTHPKGGTNVKSRKSLTKSLNYTNTIHPKNITEDEMKYFDDLDKEIHCDIGQGNSAKYTTTSTDMTSLISPKPVILKKSFKSKPDHTMYEDRAMNLDSASTGFSEEGSRVPSTKSLDQIPLQKSEMDTHQHDLRDIISHVSSSIKSQVKPSQVINEFITQDVTQSVEENVEEIEEFTSQVDGEFMEDSFNMTPIPSKGVDSSVAADPPPCISFGRHIVMAVNHTQDDSKELCMKECMTQQERRCILSGFWCDIHVDVEDVVHVLAKFDQEGTCRISDQEGLIIVNPDLLISGTTVVSTVFCMRKSVLNEKFKGLDRGNIQMLYGSIIHQVFQQVLRKKIIEKEKILEEAKETVQQLKFLHDMYGNSVTEAQVMEEIEKYVTPLQKWLSEYTDIGQNVMGVQRKCSRDITILKVKDIEENIWSPRYGVKGKIDLTVEVKIKKKGTVSKSTVPLELKTGRASFSMEHKGQVTLYSMMTSDRREDPGQGLLLYLKEPDMKVIPADHAYKRGLVQLRNEMAYYISRQVSKFEDSGHTSFMLGRLPEPINNHRACGKCPQLLNCTMYQRSIEERELPANHAMSGLVSETLKHLSDQHLEYFSHWSLLLNLEAKAGLKAGGLKDIWCKSGKEREAVGECISGLMLYESQTSTIEDSEQIVIQFYREMSLGEVGLRKHDYVILSAENSTHIAVCTGTITEIDQHFVHLSTEREALPRLQELKNGIYRMDKYDGYNTSAILYCNLSNLLKDDHKSARLRELIIDSKKPEFISKMSKGVIEKVKSVFKPLNKPQKTAILKVLMAKDYVLIRGYPGTGKTSTIVSLVKVLQSLGQSILLTSYTHSAVDNILLKLKKDGIDFLRLGKLSSIHASIHPYTCVNRTQNLKSVGELREFYTAQKIVATSSLGINHALFTQRRFDVCVIDEASQILQLASLGPLFYADKFVLVGDPKQLPPVIQSREARDLGMDESLFARLDTGVATFDLNLQYRMNRDIMYLSNTLVYNGALKCGNDDVANSHLIYPQDNINQILSKFDWLTPMLTSDPYQAVLFYDTGSVPAPEIRDNNGLIKNEVEAQIVQTITQAFIQCGICGKDIGVIAPYRHQVSLIKFTLSGLPDIEVNTVDQYQGRDKDIIVISFTCSFTSPQDSSKSGQLLKDVRRLNVAITRAKKKLIMIGDISTLQRYEPMSDIIKMMKEQRAIHVLSRDLKLHK